MSEKTLQEHVKEIDHRLGNKLSKLYSNTFNYQVILDHFFGVNKEAGKFKLSASNKFIRQLISLIKNEYIEFDDYLVILLALVRQIPVNITYNDQKEFELEEKIFISKSVEKNHFIYNNFKNIQIVFSLISDPPEKPLDRNYIIQLENIKSLPNRLKCNVFYKSFSSYYFYILSLILLVIILVWKVPALSNIIDFINTQLQNCKFFCYLFAGIAIIVVIALIYKPYTLVRRIIKWVSSRHEYSIEKKYSSIEQYKEVVASDKFFTLRPFEGNEQPIAIPSEDIIGFNLLSALFYYNYILYGFSPIINRIIILDGVKGIGKTSFINLLKNKIHGYEQSNCKTFKQYISGNYINVVQLSLMPLIASTGDVNFREIIRYLADNLYGDESLYLRRLLSVFNSNNKFNLENIKEILGINDNIQQLRKHIKRSEQKNIIIVEDIDRLDDNELKKAVKFLWFIYELPFTITILPGDDARIRKAINFANDSNQKKAQHLNIKILPSDEVEIQKVTSSDCLDNQSNNKVKQYHELEEFKLLQASFSFKEHVYKALANYSVELFSSYFKKLDVKSSYQQLAEVISFLRNDKSPELSHEQGFSNEWTSHVISTLAGRTLLKHELIEQLREIVIKSYISDSSIKQAIINDITQILRKYHVSIREMKWIILKLNPRDGSLFFVQQIICYILYYRYKDQTGIMDYLKAYSLRSEFLESSDLIYPLVNDDLKIERRNLTPDYTHDLINDLEKYPTNVERGGMVNFINQLFTFQTALSKNRGFDYNNISRKILHNEFVRGVLIRYEFTPQQIYDQLSKNWLLNGEQLNISFFSQEFILAFNTIAEQMVERESQVFSYNLFLYQNMAILLLQLIQANEGFTNAIDKYIAGDRLYNHAICLGVKIFSGKITFEIAYLIDYFRTLFNIDYHSFKYDKTHQVLQENYKKLREEFIPDNPDPKFLKIFTGIFK